MNSAGKSGVTADGLGEAMQPGLTTGSSAITVEDNSKYQPISWPYYKGAGDLPKQLSFLKETSTGQSVTVHHQIPTTGDI